VTEATPALAVTDYVPVALSALALWRVATLGGARAPERLALLRAGVIIVTAGGVVKATGKLILAMDGRDVVLLNQGLFPLLAPGMLLLALGMSAALAGRDRPRTASLIPLALILVAASSIAAGVGAWSVAKPALIAITSAANVALLVILARAAVRDGAQASSALFIASLVGVLALAGMSRALEPTIANQWIEQGSNTLVQGLLVAAVGSWRWRIETADHAMLGGSVA